METVLFIIEWACLITGAIILIMGAILGACEVLFFVLDKTLKSLGLMPVFWEVLNEIYKKRKSENP